MGKDYYPLAFKVTGTENGLKIEISSKLPTSTEPALLKRIAEFFGPKETEDDWLLGMLDDGQKDFETYTVLKALTYLLAGFWQEEGKGRPEFSVSEVSEVEASLADIRLNTITVQVSIPSSIAVAAAPDRK